ncbi:uncharacterized protein LOC120211197 [Hibiscus syriacus]|uniref:uncharacterized protein LOC120211197 n=1 Tax=Hibiscus syriacus TaxID=106335 RepID=UPI001924B3A4|nr:uncharacterized protein LOC120211197 [Hibiscus syriacus]
MNSKFLDVNAVTVIDGFGTLGYGDISWYPDFAATTHLTPDAGIIINSSSVGSGKVAIANEMDVPISKIGKAILCSQSRSLYLNNLLHDPTIGKKLLSISRFTKDNSVSIEFYPTYCVVKDLATRQVIESLDSNSNCMVDMHADSDVAVGGLGFSSSILPPVMNRVISNSVSNVCNNVVSSSELWHRRLGHPFSVRSCPHTLDQNGMVDRKHHHIVETGLTLMAQTSVPFKFWSDAFDIAVYLINRLPTKVLQGLPRLRNYFISSQTSVSLEFSAVSSIICAHVGSVTRSDEQVSSDSIRHSVGLFGHCAEPTVDPTLAGAMNPSNDLVGVGSNEVHVPFSHSMEESSLYNTSGNRALSEQSGSNSSTHLDVTETGYTHQWSPDPRLECSSLKPFLLKKLLRSQKNIHHAMKHTVWKETVEKEFDALTKKGNWDLVVLPSDLVLIGYKWLFKVEEF